MIPGQFNPPGGAWGTQFFHADDLAVPVEQEQADRALKNQKTFEPPTRLLSPVPMGANVTARLQHVEKTLNQITLLMEVVIEAQTGDLLGFEGHLVERC